MGRKQRGALLHKPKGITDGRVHEAVSDWRSGTSRSPLQCLTRRLQIVLPDSELFVYVNKFLAGVVKKETTGEQEESRE